jgi:hypothetical protein
VLFQRIQNARTTNFRPVDLGVAVAFAAGGVCLLAFATRTGLALKPDSVSYLGGAHALAHGHGYTTVAANGTRRAIVDWPPLYSLVLGALERAGAPLLEAARALNLALFGLTTLLIYFLLLRTSGASRVAASLGTAAFVVSPTLLPRFGFALSEAPFLLLLVAAIILLDEYLRRPTWWALGGAAAVSALACATRLSGVALVIAGTAALLSADVDYRAARLRAAALFSVIGISPFIAWTAWSATRSVPTARSLGFHLAFQRLQNGYGVTAQWLFPEPIPSLVRVPLFGLVLAGGALLLAWTLRHERAVELVASLRGLPPGAVAALWFAGAYIFLLVITMSFLDRVTRADARILSPLFVALVVLAPALLKMWVQAKITRSLLVAGACAIVALYAVTTISNAVAGPIRGGYLPRHQLSRQGVR